MFLCIPLAFGFPTFLSAFGDQSPRICPRCNNASVHSAKSRTWFEFCFIPLIPCASRRIWMCNICQWVIPMQEGGWEPTLAANPAYPPIGPGGHAWQPPSHQAYQPAYLNPQK